MNETYLRRS